jgi:hypothetical protein
MFVPLGVGFECCCYLFRIETNGAPVFGSVAVHITGKPKMRLDRKQSATHRTTSCWF